MGLPVSYRSYFHDVDFISWLYTHIEVHRCQYSCSMVLLHFKHTISAFYLSSSYRLPDGPKKAR